MSEGQIYRYADGKGFRRQTVDRWLSWDEADREALLHRAVDLKLGENHLRDFMDWLEEISLRDGVAIRDILEGESIARIASEPRLSRGDKLKRIKEEIRRLRFPRLSRVEDRIQELIRGLKLQPQVRISVPPGLEGGRLSVEFTARSHAELKLVSSGLAEAAAEESVGEIFDLMTQGAAESGRESKN